MNTATAKPKSNFLSRLTWLLTGQSEDEPETKDVQERDRVVFKHTTTDSLNVEPGKTYIAYDPTLVSALKDDHKRLVSQFNMIDVSVRHGQFDDTRRFLREFLNLLRLHVLEENLKLYGGIDCATEGSEAKEMKGEMITIQRQVSKFVDGYLNVGLDHSNAQRFLEKWVGRKGDDPEAIESRRCSIGGVLTDRIDVEEKRLYRIYESLGDNQKALSR